MFSIKEMSINEQICFQISNLITVCPFTNKEDVSEIRITYRPGKYKISEPELEDFIKKKIEREKIGLQNNFRFFAERNRHKRRQLFERSERLRKNQDRERRYRSRGQTQGLRRFGCVSRGLSYARISV